VPDSNCYIKNSFCTFWKENSSTKRKKEKCETSSGSYFGRSSWRIPSRHIQFDLARWRNFSLGKGVLNPIRRLCSCVL